ncbi:MAG: PKD domain-containing protein, partial [Phycisphaerales bacterium]|nr:PKD domain-containing protein [Phycisphaerales bacterium]
MVYSTKSPRSSYSKVRSYLFTNVAGAFLLFAFGCNAELSPPAGDGLGPPLLDSTVSPGDWTNGGNVAPAGAADSPQPPLTISAKPVFCCNLLSIDFDLIFADPADQLDVARYSWDFGDGFRGAGKVANHTYGRVGTYAVEVIATHTDGTSEMADTTLAVGVAEPTPPSDTSTSPSDPPTTVGNDTSADTSADVPPAETTTGLLADAGPDRIVNEGDVVLLDGGGSRGSGTTALSYAWRQLSGPFVQLQTPNSVRATFVAPMGYAERYILSFELTVKGSGQSKADRTQVTVVPPAIVTPPVDAALPTKEQLTAWLAELPPLPKVHYSFPILQTMLVEPVDPLLVQYVRVSRAVSVAGEGANESHLKAAVTLCQQANTSGVGIPASIAINYSPWHRIFPPDLPPTYTGPESDGEIQMFRDRLISVRQTLASINASRGTQIAITAILLDTERFYVKPASDPDADVWNAAIDAKYTAFYNVARQLYPNASVEWYGRGIEESAAATGWSPFPWFTFREPGDSFSCALYRVSEIGAMRETFRRTYDFADEHGVSRVTPWIALGAGYRRQPDQFELWYTDWDYDTVYSLLLGREINTPWYGQQPDRFAPWGAAEIV